MRDRDEKENKVKIAIILNLIGEDDIEINITLGLDDQQRTLYTTVLTELETYFTPKKIIVYERCVFYNRKQEGEGFDHFLTYLRKLVKSCEFTESDSTIRD